MNVSGTDGPARAPKILYRLVRNRRVWRPLRIEYCPSCDSRNPMIHSTEVEASLKEITRFWDASAEFKEELLKRENDLCANCLASFRMRSVARTVLSVLGLEDTSVLLRRLSRDTAFRVYEAACYGIFRTPRLKELPNYVVSEYFGDRPREAARGSVRNENLERLSFPDGSFDIVITSEVLEHVARLDRALEEIRRVLRPGGTHVFSVPVDRRRPRTVERMIVEDGKTVQFLPPEMHGDTIRAGGIPAYRSFGADVLDYLGRDGFRCIEDKHRLSGEFIASVYCSRKGL